MGNGTYHEGVVGLAPSSVIDAGKHSHLQCRCFCKRAHPSQPSELPSAPVSEGLATIDKQIICKVDLGALSLRS